MSLSRDASAIQSATAAYPMSLLRNSGFDNGRKVATKTEITPTEIGH